MLETDHLLYGVGAIATISLVISLMIFAKRRARTVEHPQREQEIEASVSQDAAMAELALSEEQAAIREDAALSDSGAFAIHELVDMLVRSGDLDSAEKWASNALRSQPDHVEVAVTLAGIYHQRKKRNEFFAIVSEHIIRHRDDIDTDEWRKIERMMSDFSTAENARE
jgi:thioredoxin-like negative regulator of GroEL